MTDPFTEPNPESLSRRLEADAIHAQSALLRGRRESAVLDKLGCLVAILNDCRQAVYLNRAMLDLMGHDSDKELLGLRPGEIFHCQHAGGPFGCGTSEECRDCGARLAILCGLDGEHREEECRILTRHDDAVEALDLKATACPLDLDGERYVVFTLTDISHEKRRRILERVFIHDIMNTAGSLEVLAEFMSETIPETFGELKHDAECFRRGLVNLSNEIAAHRDLLAAEGGDLRARPKEVDAGQLMEAVATIYRHTGLGQERHIVVLPPARPLNLETDPVLLRRVLGNMVKNALEAVRAGDTVTMGLRPGDDAAVFWVHNAGQMVDEARRQVFKRSFTTKGVGRGIGTYSMKLLGEGHLCGRVWFETGPDADPDAGTTFFIRLPLAFPHPKK